MSRLRLAQSPALVSRALRSSNTPRASFGRIAAVVPRVQVQLRCQRRLLSTSHVRPKGMMPDTDNPLKKPSGAAPTYAPRELTDDEYHELADAYLDNLLVKFEEQQDQRGDLDVEFSAGVMTISTTEKGTYVINKQPPNRQIWLSSPTSGPKRYDWCLVGESQNEKEGTGSGNWIYTRDGSSLDELILSELGVAVGGGSGH